MSKRERSDDGEIGATVRPDDSSDVRRADNDNRSGNAVDVDADRRVSAEPAYLHRGCRADRCVRDDAAIGLLVGMCFSVEPAYASEPCGGAEATYVSP